MNVGLIGAGFMGTTHSDVYKILTCSMDVCLYGVYDVNKDAAISVAKVHGAKVYECYEDMLKDKNIHIIDICLPTYLHAEYGAKALYSNKHIFIEKPVVLNKEQAKILMEAKEKSKREVMVGQCIRLWPQYMYLKKLYDNKTYGNLKDLSLKRVSSRPQWGFENWYNDNEKCGGAILDLYVHDVDFMRYMLGEPDTKNLFGSKDHVYSVYEYGKMSVSIESGWDFAKGFPVIVEYRGNFDNATVVFSGDVVEVYENTGRRIIVDMEFDYHKDEFIANNSANLAGYYNELKYFYNCLLENKKVTICPLEEGIKTINLINEENN